jgi:hypothetical protein
MKKFIAFIGILLLLGAYVTPAVAAVADANVVVVSLDDDPKKDKKKADCKSSCETKCAGKETAQKEGKACDSKSKKAAKEEKRSTTASAEEKK